jgi:EpsI family protein
MNQTRPAKHRWALTVLLTAAMVAAAATAKYYTPTTYMADGRGGMKLEKLVPTSFGNWRLDPSITPLMVDPSQLELVDRLYSQTVARTYVNTQGHQVMLTIAYGRDQSDGLQVHTPEACYPVAGFAVGPSRREDIDVAGKPQPVVKLTASIDGLSEPITYWVTVGDYVVTNGAKGRRDVRFKYGFQGKIPDGMLFRLSSRGQNQADEYAVQGAFLTALHQSLSKEASELLFGKWHHED